MSFGARARARARAKAKARAKVVFLLPSFLIFFLAPVSQYISVRRVSSTLFVFPRSRFSIPLFWVRGVLGLASSEFVWAGLVFWLFGSLFCGFFRATLLVVVV